MAPSRSSATRTSQERPASFTAAAELESAARERDASPGCATSTVASSVARAHSFNIACANPSPSGAVSSSGCASKRRLMPSVYISKSHSAASAISTGRTRGSTDPTIPRSVIRCFAPPSWQRRASTLPAPATMSCPLETSIDATRSAAPRVPARASWQQCTASTGLSAGSAARAVTAASAAAAAWEPWPKPSTRAIRQIDPCQSTCQASPLTVSPGYGRAATATATGKEAICAPRWTFLTGS